MTTPTKLLGLASLAVLITCLAPSAARAQSADPTPTPTAQPAPTPPYPYQNPYQYPYGTPPPSTTRAPNGEYVAPLAQPTQPVYVPQSVALSGPRMLTDWQPGMPVPPGYHPAERVRKGEIISGLITFGVPYIYSSLIAAATDDSSGSHADALWIPVLGPFIEMSQSHSVLGDYALVLDGLAQGLGLGLAIHGLTSPRHVLLRNDLAMVTVAPVRVGHDGNGLGVLGRF